MHAEYMNKPGIGTYRSVPHALVRAQVDNSEKPRNKASGTHAHLVGAGDLLRRRVLECGSQVRQRGCDGHFRRRSVTGTGAGRRRRQVSRCAAASRVALQLLQLLLQHGLRLRRDELLLRLHLRQVLPQTVMLLMLLRGSSGGGCCMCISSNRLCRLCSLF